MKKLIAAILILLTVVNVCTLVILVRLIGSSDSVVAENSENVETLHENCRDNLVSSNLFYGTWEIKHAVKPDYTLPDGYIAQEKEFTENEMAWENLYGTKLEITNKNIKHFDSVYNYDAFHNPKVFVMPISADHNSDVNRNDVIRYYKDESLGFDGEFIPYMDFVLEGNTYRTMGEAFSPSESFSASDFTGMYLLDKDTAYISDGVLVFLMCRITE